MPAVNLLSCARAGAQLLCLNYQTNDAGQQLNRALFRLNGSCGYVLQGPLLTHPEAPYLPHPTASDKAREAWAAMTPARRSGKAHTLHLQVVCAQHLPKSGEERIAPDVWDHFDPQGLMPSHHRAPSLNPPSTIYVTVEAWHQAPAGSEEATLRHETKRVEGNGLNPSWEEHVNGPAGWYLARPNAAFVRLAVHHRGVLKDECIGSEVLPVVALRQGYRSVQLRSPKGLRLQLAALLVHIRFEPKEEPLRRFADI